MPYIHTINQQTHNITNYMTKALILLLNSYILFPYNMHKELDSQNVNLGIKFKLSLIE
jgi:hypothetical protein